MARTVRKIPIVSTLQAVAPPPKVYYIVFEGYIDQEATQRLYLAIENSKKISASRIIIFLSSLGGSIYEGFLLATLIQNSKIPITIHATNHIDSIANVIYLSAKERTTESHAKFYLHGSSTKGNFDENELMDQLSATRTNNTRIAYFISENANIPLKKVKAMMKKGVTISAQEALEYGISHQVIHREVPTSVTREDIIYIN